MRHAKSHAYTHVQARVRAYTHLRTYYAHENHYTIARIMYANWPGGPPGGRVGAQLGPPLSHEFLSVYLATLSRVQARTHARAHLRTSKQTNKLAKTSKKAINQHNTKTAHKIQKPKDVH